MHVKRMRLFNVKPLRRDLPQDGAALPEPAHHRLLLQGGNGSGKTTILETIRTLWEFFGEWIDRGSGKQPVAKHTRHYLAQADLAAVEFADFPAQSESIWIGIGKANEWADLKKQHPEAAFAGLVRYGKDQGQARIELPARDWQSLRLRSLAGSEPQPNILHFPPDNRTVAVAPKEGAKLVDTTDFNWSGVYNPKLDLDSLLLTVKALRSKDFEESLRLVNLALGDRNKRVTDFGANGRLEIEGKTDFGLAYRHPPEMLSSGERQMLLLVSYTVGFLRPGGIVLLDEPDLHIHISMVTQLLETLEQVIRQRGGQFIVASHSERVWDWFSRDAERIELTPWRGGQP